MAELFHDFIDADVGFVGLATVNLCGVGGGELHLFWVLSVRHFGLSRCIVLARCPFLPVFNCSGCDIIEILEYRACSR